jgi:heme o synthase
VKVLYRRTATDFIDRRIIEMEKPAQMNQETIRQKSAARFSYLLITGLIFTFLALTLGHVQRLYLGDEWVLPVSTTANLETIYQIVSLVSAVFVLISAAAARIHYHPVSWISRPLYLSAIVVTAKVSTAGVLAPLQTALHLAVLGLGLVGVTAWFIFHKDTVPHRRSSLSSPFGKLASVTLLVVFILMVSGTAVSTFNANQACSGWPFCSGGLPSVGLGWLAFIHRLITLAAGILVTIVFVRAWRSQRSQQVILTAASIVFVLFAGQILVSAVMTLRAYTPDLVGLHAVSAGALWGALVILVAATAFAARTAEEELEEMRQPLPLARRLKDFVLLSKPIIVLLLLVTTYAGMVVGGKGIPTLAITFWTMLGGALAAGGSSALNQFIDREIDKAMQRTAKRPLPDGRLTPAEGLAYGASAVVVSFFMLAAFVNLLAALLALAGAVYYVLLYSIWLKRLTVQNIVIGGGAGAIPPLVGWAAASGSLNIPSLFLFAIVFLWTPPHFWALALVRSKDYARAGIPMLPVVQGEHATRKQIFIYTLELVALTLLMPLLNITGSVFLISAIVLGAWLIFSAWRVLRLGGNKIAWKMYRHSSMYLAFLFLALVLDVLFVI